MYNNHHFTNLLVYAVGKQKNKDFANRIGVSREHLSRMLTEKYDRQPYIKTVRSILESSSENISLHELADASGYEVSELYPRNINFNFLPDSIKSEFILYYVKEDLIKAISSNSFNIKNLDFIFRNIEDNFFDDISLNYTDKDLGKKQYYIISCEWKNNDNTEVFYYVLTEDPVGKFNIITNYDKLPTDILPDELNHYYKILDEFCANGYSRYFLRIVKNLSYKEKFTVNITSEEVSKKISSALFRISTLEGVISENSLADEGISIKGQHVDDYILALVLSKGISENKIKLDFSELNNKDYEYILKLVNR